ncbi:MAG: TonB-dependent receptor [Gemmatimonadota bacterium]
MPRIGRASARVWLSIVLSGLLSLVFNARPASAQSLVSGSLSGEVRGTDDSYVSAAEVTIVNRSTGNSFSTSADRRGRYSFALLVPGVYSVLAEQVGFQPIRQNGVILRPGEETKVSLRLERRPPPVENVVELPESPRSSLSHGRVVGQEIRAENLQFFDQRQDVTGISRDLSSVAAPDDGRAGYAFSAEGLPQSYSRIFVDGIEEIFLRHPGIGAEPATTPAFSRNSLSEASALENAFDIEWRGTSGSLLSALSRDGSDRMTFSPYLTYSGSGLGGRSNDNPASQSTSQLQAGAILSGSLVKDTSQYVLGFNYQSLEQPTANPWEGDSASFFGNPVSLRAALPGIAADSFSADIGAFTTPTVRTFRGGNAFGRLDWRLSSSMALFARFGFAKWKEQNAQLGEYLVSGLGTRLEARDISGALGIASAWSRAANEFRFGVHLSKRDWISSLIPTTDLVAEGVGIGVAPVGDAGFDQRGFDLNNTFQYNLSDHQIKLGLGLGFVKWSQDYAFGRNGIFQFGDLDGFANGQGDFFQVVAPSGPDISTRNVEVFLQDVWSVSESFRLEGGLRYDVQSLPSDKIQTDTSWVNASGLQSDASPHDGNNISPRIGFVWDVRNRGTWVLRGGGGLYYSRMNLGLFSEAALYDGGAVVRRGQGTFDTWPVAPDSVDAPVVGPRLTLFDASYQDPRTSKWSLALSHALAGRVTVEVTGVYHHTDFIPRRTDLNRLASSTGLTQEGRPIYGTLVKQGGLVSAAPGSNRRFSGFDLVSGVVSSGFSDYYGVTLAVERRAERGLGLRAAYTYSRTTDNWALDRTGDPTDQLSPFPEDGTSSEWLDGRSDLDIPHRLVLSADYHFPGKLGMEMGVRFRYRSGLAFTPGFRPGVDPNGDGSGQNDPAFVDNSIAGVPELVDKNSCLSDQVGQFAERNSCRQKAARALDLHLAIRLPVQLMGSDLRLMLDGFNLVSTESGLVDRALFLVDPAQPLTTSGSNVTIPLIANPGFGGLLSRRGEPRLIRLGLKVDY